MSGPIVVSRRIAAPPEQVYRYFTEASRWVQWQGVDSVIQPEPGGELVMTMPNGAVARGRFVELVPHKKVVFTWGWDDHPTIPPGSSTVEVEISEVAGESLVTLTHHDLPKEEIPLHLEGWQRYIPRLAAAAEGRQVPADTGE